MTLEHARARSVPKPWGVADARPWSTAGGDANAIGEIWYNRSDSTALPPSLLLKLLFTNKPLSIQVHPDDKFAISIGLPRGKSEAWYILSATPDAKVALGLKRQITTREQRAAQATDERAILVSNPHFVFERLTLRPNSSWRLAAERETWLLILSGGARIGSFVVGIGDGIFAQSDRVDILAGAGGMVCLAAYTGGNPISDLLQDLQNPGSLDPVATSFPHARAGPANRRPETSQ